MNAYLERQQKAQQTYLEVGEDIGMQKMWDYVQLVLRDPKIMGKNTVGKDRMKKIFDELTEVASTYHTAFTADPEADYYQEKLDEGLREIWGEQLQTFFERYPCIKQFRYDKPRKEWR